MDYASLTADKSTAGSIANWVNWRPLEDEAPDLIKNAQDELFSRLRVREMRKALSLGLNQGDISAPLPADFLDAVTLNGPFSLKLKRISDDRLIDIRATDASGNPLQGYPSRYGIFDSAFQFDMAAQQSMIITGLYYGALYITPSVLNNVLTDRYSHLFRAMLLKHAYGYRKDWDAATKYAQQVEANLEEVESGDDLAYRDLDDADMGLRL